jgi:hypothetical protein
LSRKWVRPAQYVGAVQLASRTVEFLPKIEHMEGVSDVPAVRHNLLRMLLVAYDLGWCHSRPSRTREEQRWLARPADAAFSAGGWQTSCGAG